MKIKRKVQKNLPQLIEWAWENDIKNKGFESERTSRAYFDYDGYLSCTRAMEPTDTFSIEVEEEIMEEIKLDLLLDHFINPYGQHHVGNIYRNRSINDILEENDEMEIATYSIHLFDIETNEFKLIWRKGKLVE